MADILRTVTSILQLVDTALEIWDRYAAEEQHLLSEIGHLRPLLVEFQSWITVYPSSPILQKMKSPLAEFEAEMKLFTEKLRPKSLLLSRLSQRVNWTAGNKHDTQEYLGKFEQFKSLLNSWLSVEILGYFNIFVLASQVLIARFQRCGQSVTCHFPPMMKF
jgi:hypothetical protein